MRNEYWICGFSFHHQHDYHSPDNEQGLADGVGNGVAELGDVALAALRKIAIPG
jgi:hypothetical protein